MKKIPGNLLKNLEKLWKYHGILSVRKSGNPETGLISNTVFTENVPNEPIGTYYHDEIVMDFNHVVKYWLRRSTRVANIVKIISPPPEFKKRKCSSKLYSFDFSVCGWLSCSIYPIRSILVLIFNQHAHKYRSNSF